jgi:hypothetical protein
VILFDLILSTLRAEAAAAAEQMTDDQLLDQTLSAIKTQPGCATVAFEYMVAACGRERAERVLRPVVSCTCGCRVRLALERGEHGRCHCGAILTAHGPVVGAERPS